MMPLREDGGPAFPRPASEDRKDGDMPDGNRTVGEQDGMSILDYTAVKTLAGILANPMMVQQCVMDAQKAGAPPVMVIVKTATMYALALIEELKKA